MFRRLALMLAAAGALALIPVSAAHAAPATGCRLDFHTWPGGFSATGQHTGSLSFLVSPRTTVTQSWNASISVSATRVSINAAGWFGFNGTTVGPLTISGAQPACAITIDGRPVVDPDPDPDPVVPSVIAEPDVATAPEGGGVTITVRLSAPPSGTVSLGVTSTGTGVWASQAIVHMFGPTNWNVVRSIPMYSMDDADSVDDTVTLTFSAPGYQSDTVVITQNDND